MKKLFLIITILVIICFVSVLILIPRQLKVVEVTFIKTNEALLFRNIVNEENWKRWWPDTRQFNNPHQHSLAPFKYILSKKLYNAVGVRMQKTGKDYDSKILLIPIANDSIGVKWESTITSSTYNPIQRFSQYQEAKSIKRNMQVILNSLKAFTENPVKAYALDIRRTTLTDSIVLSTKIITKSPPSNSTIYKTVKRLKEYIADNDATETNYPMLNITKENIGYITMVGIPINKPIKEKGDITRKRLIAYKDKVLTAEIRGGNEKIREAYDKINTYLKDYDLSTPVIPWEYLITDREKEIDSTKWITRIYVPIV